MFHSEKKPPAVERKVPTKEQNLQYYKYSRQIQDAVRSLDLKALDLISETILSDRTFEMDERQQICERIKKEKIGVIISQYARLGNVPLLHSVEDLIEKSSMSDFEKKVYMMKIIDGIVTVELSDAIARDDIEKMRAYQKKVFLDETIDNKKREYIFDSVERLIKQIQLKKEKKAKMEIRPGRVRGLDFSGVRASTDLRHMPREDREQRHEDIFKTYPLDIEAIVSKFRLYDFKKLQEFRERLEAGEYPMYKDKLLGIVAAFQEEFDKDKTRIEARRVWVFELHKTFKTYRNELRNPSADMSSYRDRLKKDVSEMKLRLKKDLNVDAEDRATYKRKLQEMEHDLSQRYWTRVFDDAQSVYQKQRSEPKANHILINKAAYEKMKEISRNIANDEVLSLEEKGRFFLQISSYMAKYPTAASHIMARMRS